MSERIISIDDLGAEISRELSLYGERIIKGVKEEAHKSIKELTKLTKATAPVGRRRKHYRDSITYTKLGESSREISFIWYVKGSDYRLSHLLEHGHALHFGGRVEGTHFIREAHDSIIEKYYKAVEEVIENG